MVHYLIYREAAHLMYRLPIGPCLVGLGVLFLLFHGHRRYRRWRS